MQSVSSVHKAGKKPSYAMRWLNIVARTFHLAVSAVLFGGFVLSTPFAHLAVWHRLTIASGFFLLALEWLHDFRWPHRSKGIIAIIHCSLALVIHLRPSLMVPVLWMILVSGCIGSHMPYKFRNWSFIEGLEAKDR